MSAVIVLVALLKAPIAAAAPSATDGDTVPSPVKNTFTYSPGSAGLDDDTTVPSALCRIAPSPSPLKLGMVNTPGVVSFTTSVTKFELAPLLTTWNCASAKVFSNGISTDTAPG